MPGILEVRHLAAGGGHHRRGREQTDAGNRQQRRAGRTVFGHRGQFALQLGDAGFEQADFLDQQFHRTANQSGHRRMGVGQHPADGFDSGARPLRDGQTELPAEAAQRVDARGARAHPQRAGAVQALQRLLFDGFDAHRHDVGGTRRFQQRTGVGGIGLVALHVGTNVGGGQKLDLDAQPVDPARPVVRGATGFHDDQRDLAILKPALELGAGETMRFDDLPGRIGHGQLEDALCQIDSNGSSMHFGFLLGVVWC